MQEGPGFAVGVVEAGAGISLAAEKEAGAAAGGEEGHIPGVLGDDVDGEEVDSEGR